MKDIHKIRTCQQCGNAWHKTKSYCPVCNMKCNCCKRTGHNNALCIRVYIRIAIVNIAVTILNYFLQVFYCLHKSFRVTIKLIKKVNWVLIAFHNL